ncbi:GIN domain-containing protein [Yoonia sp. SS1-5]|uniref:GIN domain-containing protein n=1 Tax=Yoonia rhodophyticola TaxID=3137370 RepID=A0AAN0NLA8_9RHOB
MKLSPLVVIGLLGATSLAAQEETLAFEGFRTLTVSDGLRARVEIGDTFSVKTRGIPDDRYAWNITQEGADLRVGLDFTSDGSLIDMSDRFRIAITMPQLDQVAAQTGAHLDIIAEELDGITVEAMTGAGVWLRNVELGDVSLSASTGASVELTGECAALALTATDGGFVDADDLECLTVVAEARNGGSLRYHAEETASVIATGGARVVGMGDGKMQDALVSGGSSFSVR